MKAGRLSHSSTSRNDTLVAGLSAAARLDDLHLRSSAWSNHLPAKSVNLNEHEPGDFGP
jgi:hypothetical protein